MGLRILICFLLLAFAMPGFARSLTTTADEDCPEQMSLTEDVAAGAPAGELEVAEVVVPCAMAESGVLGGDCHDAPFYVVSTSGTLLCRVDVAVFSQQHAAPHVDDAPPASGGVDATRLPGAALTVLVPMPRPPLVHLVSRASVTPGVQAADAHCWSWPRPS